MNRRPFGSEIVRLSVLIRQNLEGITAKFGITSLQSRIMLFIYRESQVRDIYQKDIENEFKIRKSSVSSVMNTMLKNGLIIRETAHDGRCKKIVLSQKGLDMHIRIDQEIRSFDDAFRGILSEEERSELARIIKKLSNYLENK